MASHANRWMCLWCACKQFNMIKTPPMDAVSIGSLNRRTDLLDYSPEWMICSIDKRSGVITLRQFSRYQIF